MPNPIVDRSGEIFGTLTILRRHPDKADRWVCQCSCGKTVVRNWSSFMRAKRKGSSISCSLSCPDARKRKSRGLYATDKMGEVFGTLTVIHRHPENTPSNRPRWVCRCSCGNLITREGRDLAKARKKGEATACSRTCPDSLKGIKMQTHGLSRHPAFAVWSSMKARCTRKTHAAYKNYGGRGITVCARWLESFENFWEDMGSSYEAGLDLDRENNEEGYYPENCRWVTRKVNSQNRRNAVYVDTPWGRMLAKEAAEKAGINYTTLRYRMAQGMTGEHLFVNPSSTSRQQDP